MADDRRISVRREDWIILQRLLNGAMTKMRQIAMEDALRQQEELTPASGSAIQSKQA